MKNTQWQPISTAPKDGTPIHVYWFAMQANYFVQWDDVANVWDNIYYEHHLSGHLEKLVWKPIEHLSYNDYKHFFTK